ncbi:MAG: LCP family protein [Lachnospiraceae bacterium]|nr:LCP family protein [Lachnospiraceae bacterium]
MNDKERERMNRMRMEEEEEYEAFREEQDHARGRAVREEASYGYNSGNGRGAAPRQRRPRRKSPLGKILLAVLIVVILAGLGGYAFVRSKLSGMKSEELDPSITESISDTAQNDSFMAGYTNIALFGVDSREQDLMDGDNRSDTIIIASINKETNEVRLVSVFRDTYLDVGDGTYAKCNAAYAYGGPQQAVAMLNTNLDLNITDFVTIGFEGLADTIDAVGGIELDLTEEEVGYMNSYMEDMNYELGTPYEPVESAGVQTVSGIQATAYCRIRYTEGDDFRRAERQRTVLSKTLEKIKGASPATLMKIAESIMDETATSLSSTELLGLMTKAGSFEITEQTGFPADEQWVYGTINGQSCVVPYTLESNVIWLHGLLFGDENYQPSDAVLERSETIDSTPR